MKNLICFLLFSSLISSAFSQTPPTINDKYAKRIGSLRFSKSTLTFGNVKSNETKTDTLRMFNSGVSTITVSVQNRLAHIQVVPSQQAVEVGKEGMLIITYDVSKKNDYGFVLDRITLSTNDSQQPLKVINITASIQEFFSFPIDSLAPKARISEISFNYGSVREGEKAFHDFIIYNDGLKPLLIHKTKSTCGCIKATITKAEIAPGQSAIIHIEFDSFGKEGKDSRITSVFVNDPLLPELKLEMIGEVKK